MKKLALLSLILPLGCQPQPIEEHQVTAPILTEEELENNTKAVAIYEDILSHLYINTYEAAATLTAAIIIADAIRETNNERAHDCTQAIR